MGGKSKRSKKKIEAEAMDITPVPANLTLQAKRKNYRRYRGYNDEVYIYHTDWLDPEQCKSEAKLEETLNNKYDESYLEKEKKRLDDKFFDHIKDFRASNEYIKDRFIYKVKFENTDSPWLVVGRTAMKRWLTVSEINQLEDKYNPESQHSKPSSSVAQEQEDVEEMAPSPSKRIERASRRSNSLREDSRGGGSSSDTDHDSKATRSRTGNGTSTRDSDVSGHRDSDMDSDCSTESADHSKDTTEAESSESDGSDDGSNYAKVRPSTERASSKTVPSSRRTVPTTRKKVHRHSSSPTGRKFTVVAKHITGVCGNQAELNDGTWCIVRNNQTKSVHKKYEYAQWGEIGESSDYGDDHLGLDVHPQPVRDAMTLFALRTNGMRLDESCYVLEGVVPCKYLAKNGVFKWNCTVILRLAKDKRHKKVMSFREIWGYTDSIEGSEIYDGPIRCSISQFTKAGGSNKACEAILRKTIFGMEYLQRPRKGHQAIRHGSMSVSPDRELKRAPAAGRRIMEKMEEENHQLRRAVRELTIESRRTR